MAPDSGPAQARARVPTFKRIPNMRYERGEAKRVKTTEVVAPLFART